MLAHLPNRFNSLTRGHVRATSTPPENHYNGAKLFALARFAFARWRVCTSPRRPRRLARRSLCYDCRCVYAQLLHALGARICIYIYTSVIVSPNASVRWKPSRPRTPFSLLSRPTSGS